ncbi:MAG: hypothetical protein GY861_20610 [bacterium]|nr:hypothetical protein [bacterium]
MLTYETFTPIIDEINKLYGSEHYLPAELIWSDDTFFVKTFGKIVWDSDNCGAKSPNTIKHLVFHAMNKEILNKVWLCQAAYIQEEVMHLLNTSNDLKEALEEYFEEGLASLK